MSQSRNYRIRTFRRAEKEAPLVPGASASGSHSSLRGVTAWWWLVVGGGGGGGLVPSPAHSAHCSFYRARTLQSLTSEMKAKKVRFYRNGDRYFQGAWRTPCPRERFRSLDAAWLAELTALRWPTRCTCPHRRRALYVCASNEPYRRLDYTKNVHPSWSVGKTATSRSLSALCGGSLKGDQQLTPPMLLLHREPKDFIRPKLVTVIRGGAKPRKAVRILLNKKTAHSFEQVLTDITDAIKLDTGSVKRLYTLDGKQMSCLQDFFGEDDVFVACGPEKYHYAQDDFVLDNSECRGMRSLSHGRSASAHRAAASQSPGPSRRCKSPGGLRRPLNFSTSQSPLRSPVNGGPASQISTPRSAKSSSPSPTSPHTLQGFKAGSAPARLGRPRPGCVSPGQAASALARLRWPGPGCVSPGQAASAPARLRRPRPGCVGPGQAASAPARLRRPRPGCVSPGQAASAPARLRRPGQAALARARLRRPRPGCVGPGQAALTPARLRRHGPGCVGTGQAASARARLRWPRPGCVSTGQAASAPARLRWPGPGCVGPGQAALAGPGCVSPGQAALAPARLR
ncbi:hypothetical protein CRUP_021853 [Coryphaenoides rupestris]|nr:hypothetical protein CRUP_021853 [Coryphaenoides rupestris]